MNITVSEHKNITIKQVIALYKANNWSAANKPEILFKALTNSHTLITAWDDDKLIGLGNAISDGYLVVYYPHLLVTPNYQGKGIGVMIMKKMFEKYNSFHMQILTADGLSINFYKKLGFKKAGETQSMWIYDGNEH